MLGWMRLHVFLGMPCCCRPCPAQPHCLPVPSTSLPCQVLPSERIAAAQQLPVLEARLRGELLAEGIDPDAAAQVQVVGGSRRHAAWTVMRVSMQQSCSACPKQHELCVSSRLAALQLPLEHTAVAATTAVATLGMSTTPHHTSTDHPLSSPLTSAPSQVHASCRTPIALAHLPHLCILSRWRMTACWMPRTSLKPATWTNLASCGGPGAPPPASWTTGRRRQRRRQRRRSGERRRRWAGMGWAWRRPNRRPAPASPS